MCVYVWRAALLLLSTSSFLFRYQTVQYRVCHTNTYTHILIHADCVDVKQ